jgi:hypothetical protein
MCAILRRSRTINRRANHRATLHSIHQKDRRLRHLARAARRERIRALQTGQQTQTRTPCRIRTVHRRTIRRGSSPPPLRQPCVRQAGTSPSNHTPRQPRRDADPQSPRRQDRQTRRRKPDAQRQTGTHTRTPEPYQAPRLNKTRGPQVTGKDGVSARPTGGCAACHSARTVSARSSRVSVQPSDHSTAAASRCSSSGRRSAHIFALSYFTPAHHEQR